jgi:autoinducer 2-degrading protein
VIRGGVPKAVGGAAALRYTDSSVARQDRLGKQQQTGGETEMYVVSVTVHVQPDRVESFIKATLDNARDSRKEKGNVRFDVLQAEEELTRFLLYEAYRTKEDFTEHQQTDHYLRWKQTVADWMAQPRQGVKHHSLFFGDEEG